MVNMFFWNCQGAASKVFLSVLQEFIRKFNPFLFCLFEPRVSGDHANKICMKIGFDNWVRVEATGFSGGIWVFWKKMLRVRVLSTHTQFINLLIEFNNRSWITTCVYGSPNFHLRKRLWNDLTSQDWEVNKPWIVAGDFNTILSFEEASGSESSYAQGRNAFREWMDREGLMDLGFSGQSFTWMRTFNQEVRGARLERVVCNIDWLDIFDNTLIFHLPRVCSDHAPVLVSFGDSNSVNIDRPFRFQLAWLTHEKFKDFVGTVWNNNESFDNNTKVMPSYLKDWNVKVFGNIFKKKKKTFG